MSQNWKTPEVSPFSLKLDSGFSSRADDIFGGLGNIEAKHEAYRKVQSRSPGSEDPSLCKDDPKDDLPISRAGSSRHSSSSRSPAPSRDSKRSSDVLSQDFKRPRAPVPRRTNRLDSSRWTYYNLSDVSADDMSDRSNTAAALSFLQSRKEDNPPKKLKTEDNGMEIDSDTGSDKPSEVNAGKHVFRKSGAKSEDKNGPVKLQVQVAGRPGCVVMPEYSIGQKPAQKKPKVKSGKSGSKSKGHEAIVISHLMEDEEDEDDDTPKVRLAAVNTDKLKASRIDPGTGPNADDVDEVMETDATTTVPGFIARKQSKSKQKKGIHLCGGDGHSDEEGNVENHIEEATDLAKKGRPLMEEDSDSIIDSDLSELSSLDPKDLDLDGVD